MNARIIAALRGLMEAVETAAGRRIFWALVIVGGMIIGGLTVYRAEIPKKRFVPQLNYRSPTEFPEGSNAQAKWGSSEFRAFRIIAWGVVHEDLDPYKGLAHIRAYPPFFGIAFYPFTAFWRIPGAGSALFFLASYAFALLTAWAASRWAADRPRFGVFALVFLFLAPLALDAIVRCESDLLILFPIALGFLWTVRRRKTFRAGLLLGFAASFKVLPGLFGLYLICTRQWRALAGMVAAGICCMVLLPLVVFGPQRALDLHRSWYEVVVAPYHSGGAGTVITNPYRPSNQSMTAALNRLLRPLPARNSATDADADFNKRSDRPVNLLSLSSETVSLLVKLLQLLALGALIATWIFCITPSVAPRTIAVLMGAVAPGILLLSEVSLTTHHVLLILPLAALLVRVVSPDDAAARWWSWTLPLFLLAVVGAGIPALKAYTLLFPATAALFVACLATAWCDRAQGCVRS